MLLMVNTLSAAVQATPDDTRLLTLNYELRASNRKAAQALCDALPECDTQTSQSDASGQQWVVGIRKMLSSDSTQSLRTWFERLESLGREHHCQVSVAYVQVG